jgi:cyclic 2,3-diphosphoglycerate synthetase
LKVVVLVDGEHYPPVTRWGIEVARERGFEPVLAIMLGGTEKVSAGELPELGLRVRGVAGSRARTLAEAIDGSRPEGVLDLSDEPIVGYRDRMELAAVALARGVSYLGPDFRLDPPFDGAPVAAPTLAVIGTGKRAGKTAIAGAVARVATERALDPVVVAMGRGGPPEPEVVEAGSITLESLFERVGRGEHAAS